MMGCDIHVVAEKHTADGWKILDFSAFDYRDYGLFGFLAGVRNYSDVPPLADPRGIPDDYSGDPDGDDDGNLWLGDHSFSWLSLEELTDFDYDQQIEDRRVTRQVGPNSWDGGCTAEPGGGTTMTYREFLGSEYFADLEKLKVMGAERIVFGFDS